MAVARCSRTVLLDNSWLHTIEDYSLVYITYRMRDFNAGKSWPKEKSIFLLTVYGRG